MSITTIIDFLRKNIKQTDITLYPGASDGLIRKAEHSFRITLPDDIKEFYKFSDGFESEEDMFKIIPLDEAIDRRNEGKFYIAEYMIYCDAWQLEISPNKLNEYYISNTGVRGKMILTNSLAEFLQRFLDGGVFENGGLYEWHDQIAQKNKL